jgi:hypothetical protein
MSKNRRESATQIPYYHVIMGLQIKIVKYFSAPEQFSCQAAVFSRAKPPRRNAAGGIQRKATTDFADGTDKEGMPERPARRKGNGKNIKTGDFFFPIFLPAVLSSEHAGGGKNDGQRKSCLFSAAFAAHKALAAGAPLRGISPV